MKEYIVDLMPYDELQNKVLKNENDMSDILELASSIEEFAETVDELKPKVDSILKGKDGQGNVIHNTYATKTALKETQDALDETKDTVDVTYRGILDRVINYIRNKRYTTGMQLGYPELDIPTEQGYRCEIIINLTPPDEYSDGIEDDVIVTKSTGYTKLPSAKADGNTITVSGYTSSIEMMCGANVSFRWKPKTIN